MQQACTWVTFIGARTVAETMKAIVQGAYGQPDVLRFAEVERPRVGDKGVLVRVVSASIHKGDWHLLTGKPYLLRVAGFGVFKPNNPIPGMAIAGRIEAVGRNVVAFRVGDEVFGEIKGGGFAEYASVRADELAPKPPGVGFEDAAALPISATTALQGLRDAGRLTSGQSVLVYGSSGGVGTFAVQIAKALGVHVTGVCSARNVEMVRSIGADRVIDYEKEDFTEGSHRFDVVFDLVGNRPLTAFRRVLAERGRLVACAGGADREWLGPMVPVLAGLVSNLISRQTFAPLVAMPNKQDLLTVAGWVEAGKLRPVIDRRCTLEEVPEALRYVGLGHSRGKVVVNLMV